VRSSTLARSITSLTLLVTVSAVIAACGDAASTDSARGGAGRVDVASAGGPPMPTGLPPPGGVPVVLSPLALSGFAFWDRATMDLSTTTAVNGQLRWPSPYDLQTPHVHFAWAPEAGLTATDISNISNRNGYVVELYLDGEKLAPAVDGQGYGTFYTTVTTPDGDALFGCPQGQTCLLTSVDGSILHDRPGIWNLQLVYWNPIVRVGGVPTKQVINGYVRPNANPVSYFQDKIAPTFQSPACSKCHSLGSPQLLANQHGNLLSVNGISLTATDHGTQLRCGNGCHDVTGVVPGKTFGVTEWMVPAFDMGIDWTGKTPSQICNIVKGNLPTVDKMNAHFFDDARIAWAVNNAQLPLGYGSVGKAPPGNYTDFVNQVSAWIEGGQGCP
jgi:hypothetical protein